jgi:hypothetical protein
MRLEVPWRQGDNQSLDLTPAAGLELGSDHLDVWSAQKLSLRVEFVKCFLGETHEIVAQDVLVFGWGQHGSNVLVLPA